MAPLAPCGRPGPLRLPWPLAATLAPYGSPRPLRLPSPLAAALLPHLPPPSNVPHPPSPSSCLNPLPVLPCRHLVCRWQLRRAEGAARSSERNTAQAIGALPRGRLCWRLLRRKALCQGVHRLDDKEVNDKIRRV